MRIQDALQIGAARIVQHKQAKTLRQESVELVGNLAFANQRLRDLASGSAVISQKPVAKPPCLPELDAAHQFGYQLAKAQKRVAHERLNRVAGLNNLADLHRLFDNRAHMGIALAVIAVEQRRRVMPLQHAGQLPCEIFRIAQARTHALA